VDTEGVGNWKGRKIVFVPVLKVDGMWINQRYFKKSNHWCMVWMNPFLKQVERYRFC
jgi:hypothetical protein